MHTSLALLLAFTLARLAVAQDGKAFTNTLGMKFARIEAGAFTMGTGAAPPKSRAEWTERDFDEAPAHRVTISRPFYLGIREVTNAQYEAFDPKHKAARQMRNGSTDDDQPVVFVTWHDAMAFCAWLSKKEGKPYRLPTEAEWEFACRAGTTTKFHTGDNLTAADARFAPPKVAGKPITLDKVGKYKPNAWGLHDMHGNVAEWCLDWHGPYEAGEQTDPVGRADGYARITRGWSVLRANLDPTRYCRSANRAGHLPEDANAYTGFRVVLGAMPATKPLPNVPSPYQKKVAQTAAPKEGPDPAKPYYVKYAIDGKNPTIPKESWGPIFSQHNHYSACCVCPNGDVLFCWYTCVSESGREMAQACSRLRAGSDQWDEAGLFFDVPDVNDHAPVLFCDGKRIFHFCTESLFGWDNSSNIVRWSDDNGVTWSQPRIMLTRDAPDRLSQPCTAFQANDGTLVLACDGDVHVDERLMISKDRGQTWKVAKGDMRKAYGKYVIHPAVVPTSDGAILSFLRGPHPMPVLISRDWGDTWEVKATPFPGIGSGQKIAAIRLASGAILMCSQDSKKSLVGGGTYAALSLDDGKTWPHVRKVEGVGGYMSVAQAPNGVIYLCGSRMGCAAFNEAWLRQGKGVAITNGPDEREAKAEKAIKAQGGRVYRDENAAGMPITSVDLTQVKAIDAALQELKAIRTLKYLDLTQTNVTDAQMKELSAVENLHTVHLTGTKITGLGFKQLAGLKRLRILEINDVPLTNAGLTELGRLTPLHELYIGGPTMTDAGLRELAGLQQLQALYLGGSSMTDAGLKEMAGLQQLQALHLSDTSITGAGLSELSVLKKLRTLFLDRTKVTDAGLKGLTELKQLQNLNLRGTQVTNAGLEPVASLRQLHTLTLGETQVTDAGLKHLSRLERLEGIYLDQTKVTDAGLKELAGLKKLRTLQLAHTEISDAGLGAIAAWKDLQVLYVGMRVTDAGLKHLSGMTRLNTLSLESTQITNAGLKQMVGLRHLRWLYLQDTKITDAGLTELARMTHLQHLFLDRTELTAAGMKELRKALPKCHISPQ